MYKLLLHITLITIAFSNNTTCELSTFSINEDYFNESIVGYYIGALDMNTGSTNVSLFRYSITSSDLVCYEGDASLKLDFSFSIFSPTLGFESSEELASGKIKLDDISSPIILSNNDIDFSTTTIPGARFSLLEYEGPTEFDSPQITEIVSSILQSGKIPNGIYSFKFLLKNNSNQVIDQIEKSINVHEPSYITLISPGGSIDNIEENIVYTPLPSFFWEQDRCSNCTLGIRVCEYIPEIHISEIDAISSLSNLPISSYEDYYEINDGVNSFQYPSFDAGILLPGKIYVWQLKRSYNTTIGVSNLYSPVYSFKLHDGTTIKTIDPNIDQIKMIIGSEKFDFLFGDNGLLEGYDYNLKGINNNENDISLEELYNLSLKFKNEDYNVIEVIVE